MLTLRDMLAIMQHEAAYETRRSACFGDMDPYRRACHDSGSILGNVAGEIVNDLESEMSSTNEGGESSGLRIVFEPFSDPETGEPLTRLKIVKAGNSPYTDLKNFRILKPKELLVRPNKY